ncbi:hypothetical protein ABH15_02680 [Methanoculleus taiwanensis]|uniref:Histidine kinase/HSP90-like ATPase domain-containing protein n=1 Tax=Methanoculleus taiwanensis TaxID=1550565 RepID=A0A498H4F2_9EURY|nr:ATP-binding protein [Methanoculleus taiwanensis]RXE57055.1 hypothetical protein ABH15_02680 [Methanoculleus taiwanensis]
MYLDITIHDIRNANNVASMYADLPVELAEGGLKAYVEKLRDNIGRSREILRNAATIRRALEESGSLAAVNLDAVTREEIGNYPGTSIRYIDPGVQDEVKGRLFTRFERGKASGRGEGLGLLIVRTLVECYGGRVWIEDRVPGHLEEGASFRFTLRQAG